VGIICQISDFFLCYVSFLLMCIRFKCIEVILAFPYLLPQMRFPAFDFFEPPCLSFSPHKKDEDRQSGPLDLPLESNLIPHIVVYVMALGLSLLKNSFVFLSMYSAGIYTASSPIPFFSHQTFTLNLLQRLTMSASFLGVWPSDKDLTKQFRHTSVFPL